MKEQLAEKERDISTLRHKLEDHSERESMMRERVEKLWVENHALQNKMREVDQNYFKLESHCEQLELEVEKLTSQNDTLRHAVEVQQTTIEELWNDFRALLIEMRAWEN